MDNQKQELIQKLRDANNVLVTVSANPSVDQLAACIGLTLLLNKLHKHATAVFSGQVPSTLQFLKPEETLEKNTDSLRDFIVSLDKSKADKLRYKVEDNVVKIFITPYKTSITEADLDFSQGDFNIDVVVCLGVEKQADLDQAITSHGRILHDATVASVSIGVAGELGTLNWVEPQASSLSELTAQIADAIGREQLDGQIATSFLTGIVAETDRFSNEKTTPVTMQLSAQLMAAGANQQLVANELQAAGQGLAINSTDVSTLVGDADQPDETKAGADGTLEIGHDADDDDVDEQSAGENPEQPGPPSDNSGTDGQDPTPSDEVSEGSGDTDTPSDQPPAGPGEQPASRLMLQPPSLGGQLTANSEPESFDPSVDPLSLLNRDAPMLNRPGTPADETAAPTDDVSPTEPTDSAAPLPVTDSNVSLPEVRPLDSQPTDALVVDVPETSATPPIELPTAPSTDALPAFEPLPSEPVPPATVQPDSTEKSLAELEEAVDSPHLHADEPQAQAPEAEPVESLDAARDAVMAAVSDGPSNSLPQPTQAVGAEGYLNVQDIPDTTEDVTPAAPQDLTIPQADPTPPTSVVDVPSTAPPVPPPLPLDPAQFLPPKQ